MFTRNTEPHQKCASSTPLSTGPRPTPAVITPVQVPIAWPRWRLSWNRVRIIDMVDGINVAPAMPSRARAAISSPAVCAYAATREVAENATAPISSSRRAPTRSATAPMVTSRPARTKP